MKPLILGNIGDNQTGMYIFKTFDELLSDCIAIDVRKIVLDSGIKLGQDVIIDELQKMDYDPDLVIVLKGIELSIKTVEQIKKMFPKAILVNWFFDKYMTIYPVWEDDLFLKYVPYYDYFFCSLKGIADKLKALGHENVRYLDEGCYPPFNKEVYLNYYQQRNYGADVSFIGTIGYTKQHPNRIPILDRIINEGFHTKIWGKISCEMKLLPNTIKNCYTGTPVINEQHSMVAQSSLINIGIDQDLDLDMGHSARLYRVMCAGGFYLSTATKGLNKMFVVNKKGAKITGNEDLIIFYDNDDLIQKLDFLLEHQELIDQIRLNGQKKVVENHTFKHRLEEMMKVIKK